MTDPMDAYLVSHQRAYGKLCRDLPDGVGWAGYEVILPKVNGNTRAWLKGDSTGSSDASDDQVARIANAFANEQRVSLMRALDAGHATFADLRETTEMTAGRLQLLQMVLALAGFLRDTRQRNHYELSTVGRGLLQILLCIGKWPPDVANSEPILAPEQV